MSLINRTEELTSILCDKYRMQVREDNGEIFCFGGKLMNYPVQVFILPQFGSARFVVRIKHDSFVLVGYMRYWDTAPIELILNLFIEKLIKAINYTRYGKSM